MFTKQSAATLPISVLLVDYLGMGWEASQRAPRRKRVIPLILTLMVIPITMWMFGDYDWKETHSVIPTAIYIPTRMEYLLTQINVVRDYFRLLLFPVTQNVDYDVPLVHSFWRADVILSLLLHISLWVSAVLARKKIPLYTFGILFLYVALSVESSVIPLADVEFEHRLYLASFGIFVAIASLIKWGLARFRIPAVREPALFMLLLLFVIPLGYLTWERNQIWQSTESFWKDAALKSPNKSRALTSYARVLQTQGDTGEALHLLERAVKIDPRNTMAELSLALQYAQTGRKAKALLAAERMAKVSPDLPEYLYALGGVYMMSGEGEKAIQLLKQAVSAKSLATNSPDSSFVKQNAYENLLKLAIARGLYDDVIFAARGILEIDPSRTDTRSRLAYALQKKGDFQGAEKEYMEILRLDSYDFATYNNFAILLDKENKIDRAVAMLEEASKLRPNDIAPQVNLIMMYTERGQADKAAELYHHLPDFGADGWKTYAMLGRTFFDKGQCKLSIEPMNEVIRRTPPTEIHLLVEMHSKLAKCYEQLGETTLAREHSGEARKLSR